MRILMPMSFASHNGTNLAKGHLPWLQVLRPTPILSKTCLLKVIGREEVMLEDLKQEFLGWHCQQSNKVHGGCSHSKMNHNIDPSCQSFTGNLISRKMKRQKD
jgi:hypothetical protein